MHTHLDNQAFTDAHISGDRIQPREQTVPCRTCRTPTFNLSAGCDHHYIAPIQTRIHATREVVK